MDLLDQFTGVRQALVTLAEFRHFILGQGERVEFADLEAQVIQATLAVVLCRAEVLQALFEALHPLVQAEEFQQMAAVLRMVIHDRQLLGAPYQRLMFVLAVDVHQQFAEFAQGG